LDNGSLGELLPAQRDPVAIIARRMQMLTDLVSDINAILEVETHAPVRQPVDFSELTMGALKDFKVATAQVGLLLYEEVVPALPKIRGDATYLRRVLDNLLGNALKFTPKGGSIPFLEAGR
jgi:NtrC-family two-component system sensor histidine kinase KinB